MRQAYEVNIAPSCTPARARAVPVRARAERPVVTELHKGQEFSAQNLPGVQFGNCGQARAGSKPAWCAVG